MLILAPTRELAQQIQEVVLALGDFMQMTCHACIGDTNVKEDLKKLENGSQIVVNTGTCVGHIGAQGAQSQVHHQVHGQTNSENSLQ